MICYKIYKIYREKVKNQIMDYCSFFIKDKALFGSFPTQERVEELEENGVRYFINLTHDHESKITPYKTKYKYIQFPIRDGAVPTSYSLFGRLLLQLINIIENLGQKDRLYLHCKGGHGRSGLVVACILSYMFKLHPKEAIQQTTNFHSHRKIMRERWRILGSPQTKIQKSFVYHFFEDTRIYPFHTKGKWMEL